jgi:tetratricopeptide (TPR) repeat protein
MSGLPTSTSGGKDNSTVLTGEAPGLMQVRTDGIIQKPSIKEVKIDTSKTRGFDAKKEMAKIAEEAKSAGKVGITLNIFDKDVTIATVGMDVTRVLLTQIEGLIKTENYEEALKKISEVLNKQSDHPYALYLKAFCVLNVNQSTDTFDAELEALRILNPLAAKSRDHGFSIKIENLKTTICQQMRKKFPILIFQSLLDGPAQIIAAISEFLILDPSCADYYGFKAILLMETGQPMEAYQCVKQGISTVGDSNSKLLQELRDNLQNQVLYLLMLPSIRLYKSEEFDKARKELEKIDFQFRTTEEYLLFAAYLKKFSGGFLGLGKKKLGEVIMDGAPRDRWKVQEFIVRENITMATVALNNRNLKHAQKILEEAFIFAPEYPYLSYLLAGCIYGQVANAVLTGKMPEIDTAIQMLNISRSYIAIASADHELEQVRNLVVEIDGLIGFLNMIQQEIRKLQEEAKKVNSAITEFTEIINLGKGGISSIETFETVYQRMNVLKNQVQMISRQVSGENSISNLQMLDEAIIKNLEALEVMKADIEEQKKDKTVLDEAWGKFNRAMDSIKSGITSESQLDKLEKSLSDLRNKIPEYKNRAGSQEAKDNLRQLEDAIHKNMSDIDKVRSTIREQLQDRGVIDASNTEFQRLARQLSGGPFKSRDALINFKNEIVHARSNACSAKHKVSSGDAKKALDQMIEQYDTLLEKFRAQGL